MARAGEWDIGNEHVREYLLATEPFNMPPSVQDDQAAMRLDWLLRIHGKVCKVAAERSGNG